MKKKVRYIDTFGYENAHEMFNSSLLLMCSIVFDRVDCIASKSSFRCINQILANEMPNVSYKGCFVVGGNGKINLLLRYIVSAFQNIRQLIIAPNDCVLVYSFNNLFGLRILNLVNKLYGKSIVIFCHGELEGISSKVTKAGLLSRLLIWFSRNFFLNNHIKLSKGIYFSVMGDVIKRNLSEYISIDKMERFICIDHPYIFDNDSNDLSEDLNNDTISIGTVGAMSQVKGLDSFILFVKHLPLDVKNRINISVTGKIFGCHEELNNLGIDIPKCGDILSRNQFNSRLKSLNFILFFYSKDSYKITASGAIMDALYHKKPIIALRNDYFQYIFDKFGSFGYLCDDVMQMSLVLTELVGLNKVKQIDFSEIIDKFTPREVSNQLRQELQRIGMI